MRGIESPFTSIDPTTMRTRSPLQAPKNTIQTPPDTSRTQDRLAPGVDAQTPTLGTGASPMQSFADRVEGFVSGVNGQNEHANHMVEDFATGKHNDIHGTMLAVEQAQISMKLLGSLRNKALEAYREIMRAGA